MNTYTFNVNGMHCKACVALTESELGEVPEVKSVSASLSDLSVTITGEFGDKNFEHVARDLSAVLLPHGYSLSVARPSFAPKWREFYVAVPVALVFVALFVVLQKLGLVNLIGSSTVGYGTAFIIGLVASVSTCMAVVGGLVLSMSANFAKSGDKIRPQIYFHVSRLVAFFILGGVIGAFGSVFTLGQTGTVILSLVVSAVLLILGLNLLDVFPALRRWQVALPRGIGNKISSMRAMNHSLTPLFLGAATFFLPCGFTQSMQVYTLTTGSFLAGALTMGTFALGTLPVLALLSFSSSGIHKKARSGVFFKSAGLVVLFFGAFNLLSALVAAGIIAPIFNF